MLSPTLSFRLGAACAALFLSTSLLTAQVGQYITTGPDGVASTAAQGDDCQAIAVGQRRSHAPCVTTGADGIADSIAAGDDRQVIPPGRGLPDRPCALTGADGICQSQASGDDRQLIGNGQGRPNAPGVLAGPDGLLGSTPGGDDVAEGGFVSTGPNGLCETAAQGDDRQVIAVGRGAPGAVCIDNGPDGINDSLRGGDDAFLHGAGLGVPDALAIDAGVDGICDSSAHAADRQVLPLAGAQPDQPCVTPGPDGVLQTSAAPGSDDRVVDFVNGADVEPNGSAGYANELHGPGRLQGTTNNDPRDVYRLIVAEESDLQLALPAAAAIGLSLADADGRHIAAHVSGSPPSPPCLRTHVAAGTYYVTVGQTATAQGQGLYTLVTNLPASAIPDLLANGLAATGTLATRSQFGTWRLRLAADAQVVLQASSAALDLAISLDRERGGRILFVDDVAGSDPRLTCNLPRGDYLVRVSDRTGRTGDYTIQASATALAAPFPVAPGTGGTPGQATGTIADRGTRHLYRFVLPAAARVVFTAANVNPGGLGDPWLMLYDRDFGLVSENNSSSATALPRLDLPLPAGTYHLAVGGFGASVGNYRLTGALAQAAWTPLRTASNSYTLPSGSSMGCCWWADNPAPVHFSTSGDEITILDGSGRLRAHHAQDIEHYPTYAPAAYLTSPGYNNECGTWASAGELLHLVVSNRVNAPVTSALWVATDIWINPDGRLWSLARAGSLQFVVASWVPAWPGTPAPAGLGITGLVLVDLPSSIVLPFGVISASGWRNWPTSIAGYTGWLQALTLDPATLTGRLSNVVH